MRSNTLRKRTWRPAFDLRDLSEINRQAGQSLDACGDRVSLEQALGLSHTRVHQLVHGDPTGAPQRIAQAVAALARHPRCTPEPLVRGLVELVETVRAEALPTAALGNEVAELSDKETREQAGEDVAQHRLVTAVAALRCAGWDVRRLRPSERMELVAACAQWLDAASRELDHQLACVGAVRVLLGRVKA